LVGVAVACPFPIEKGSPMLTEANAHELARSAAEASALVLKAASHQLSQSRL
jgi:hypothetical protein